MLVCGQEEKNIFGFLLPFFIVFFLRVRACELSHAELFRPVFDCRFKKKKRWDWIHTDMHVIYGCACDGIDRTRRSHQTDVCFVFVLSIFGYLHVVRIDAIDETLDTYCNLSLIFDPFSFASLFHSWGPLSSK